MVVTEDSSAILKISWSGRWGEAYIIDKALILDASRDVRASLQRVVGHGMTEQVQTWGGLLKDLAQKGYRLYEALFTGTGHRSDRAAQEVRDWLEDELKDEKIDIGFIIKNPGIHIPWGLIYSSKTCKLSGRDTDTQVESYEDFWCLK